MKRKNGFTLIELLAVIVILAVIALIATPLIMNTINDARDSAMQRSVQNIQHAVEQHLMSKKVLDENYTFDINKFDYKGEKYDKMNIGFNDKDEAGVAVYKDNKCFYVLAGTTDVVINKELDETGCLAKAGGGDVAITEKTLISAIIAQDGTSTDTTEGFKDMGNGTYQYTGASGTGGTNWLWYGGHLWRIMTVNSNDNTMELATSYPVTAISWGSGTSSTDNCIVNGVCASLETSYVGKWLNEVFLTSLPTNVQNSLVPMTYTRQVYNGSSVTSEEISNIKVRLLTEAEYTSYSGADKYLDIKDNYWLADIYSDSYVRGVSTGVGLSYYSLVSTIGVRPVVKVSGITFTEGEGTLTSPYIASTSNAKKATDIAVGEYVSIPTTDTNNPTYLVRVISQNGGTKVALNGLYYVPDSVSGRTDGLSTFGDTTTFSKTSTIYIGALTTFKGTLDTTYFDSSDKNYNITQYPNGADYSLSTTTVASDIGLLSVGEMFSGNDIDLSTSTTKTFVDSSKILNPSLNNYSWLMNSYSASNVRYVYDVGSLYRNGPTGANGVRPAWYISDITITGGNGTPTSPYLLK